MIPTTLVLTFNQPLDPATAEDVHNYRIVGLHGRRISIRRAVYDPANQTVTLHPAQRLSVHHPYEVTVIGTGLKGLTDVQGQLLDGNESGKPGADYHLELTWRELVLGHVSREFLIRHHMIRSETPGRGASSALREIHDATLQAVLVVPSQGDRAQACRGSCIGFVVEVCRGVICPAVNDQ